MDARVILGLDPSAVEDGVVDVLLAESSTDLLHGPELVDRAVGHDGHVLGAHVLEVHADLASDAVAETDGRRGHLKGVLLERRLLLGRGIAALGLAGVGRGSVLVVVMVVRVGVAWTRRRMGVLDGPEKAYSPRGGLWSVSIGLSSLSVFLASAIGLVSESGLDLHLVILVWRPSSM